MAVSFIRIDDRLIHGEVAARWSNELPCDGLVVVDDRAALNPVVKSTLMGVCNKRTLIWTKEHFAEKMDQIVNSKKNYFVITRNPVNMAYVLVDQGMRPTKKVLNVGPQSARPGTTSIARNVDITPEEARAFDRIQDAGYTIEFRLLPESPKVTWANARSAMAR